MSPKPVDPILRFNKKYIIDQNTGCWIWQDALNGINGYGRFWNGSREQYAHRFSYETYKKRIPEGFTIHHKCLNKQCVNPEHLEAMSLGDNLRQPDHFIGQQILQTHCKRNHEFTPENTYYQAGTNKRSCIICRNMSDKKHKAIQKEQKQLNKKVRTRCDSGKHLWISENIRVTKNSMCCKKCQSEYNKIRYRKLKYDQNSVLA